MAPWNFSDFYDILMGINIIYLGLFISTDHQILMKIQTGFFFRFPFTSVIQKTYYKSRVKNTIGMKLVAETKSNKRNARLRKPDSNIMMAVYYVILDITICLRCCICVCITFNMICNFQLLCQMSVYKTFPRWLIFLQ